MCLDAGDMGGCAAARHFPCHAARCAVLGAMRLHSTGAGMQCRRTGYNHNRGGPLPAGGQVLLAELVAPYHDLLDSPRHACRTRMRNLWAAPQDPRTEERRCCPFIWIKLHQEIIDHRLWHMGARWSRPGTGGWAGAAPVANLQVVTRELRQCTCQVPYYSFLEQMSPVRCHLKLFSWVE